MDLTSPEPREAQLPRWAQEKLASLRRKLSDAQKSAEEARLATEPHLTDTLLNPYADVPIGLPKGAPVRFVVPARNGIAGSHRVDWIDVQVMGDHIQVMGGDLISVHPSSGNVVNIYRDR